MRLKSCKLLLTRHTYFLKFSIIISIAIQGISIEPRAVVCCFNNADKFFSNIHLILIYYKLATYYHTYYYYWQEIKQFEI